MTIPVLIADTFGEREAANRLWWPRLDHLNHAIEFGRTTSCPGSPPHPHGWNVFSQFWPATLFPEVAAKARFHLLRWVDSTGGDEWQVLETAKRLYELHGCLIWSNSWGADRGSQFDPIVRSWWIDWARAVSDWAADRPNLAILFSSGNGGPRESGWPQSLFGSDIALIGANTRGGRAARWSCHSPGVRLVACGHRVAVANPEGGWAYKSGTSFSCPRVAALILVAMADGLSAADAWDSLGSTAALPPQIRNQGRSPVWGYGDVEADYQAIAARYRASEHFGWPSSSQTLAAALGLYNRDLTLPRPAANDIPPLLPRP